MHPASTIDWLALAVGAIYVLSGLAGGFWRQIIHAILLYASVILALQHANKLTHSLRLIGPETGLVMLEPTALLALCLAVYVSLLSLSLWIYQRPQHKQASSLAFGSRVGGALIGLVQAWFIIVVVGMIAFPLIAALSTEGSESSLGQINSNLEHSFAWKVTKQSAGMVARMLGFWIPHPPTYLSLF